LAGTIPKKNTRPQVALTGYGQNEDRKRALDAGFDVHLTKPTDFVDLQNVIGRIPEKVRANEATG